MKPFRAARRFPLPSGEKSDRMEKRTVAGMQELYYTDARALAPLWEKGLALLPADRRAAALRLRRPIDRLGSMAAGLLLRKYLGVTGPLARAESGKPEISGGPEFSLSHGGTLAVLAVSERPVGVDAEPLDRTVDAAFYARILTDDEFVWLRASPERRFATLWTRKESAMKVCGQGLSLHPGAFSAAGESVTLEGKTYTLRSMVLDGHAVSTAAADPAPFRLHSVMAKTLTE
jgi:4'-phosphopantetheinyl transferase